MRMPRWPASWSHPVIVAWRAIWLLPMVTCLILTGVFIGLMWGAERAEFFYRDSF